MVTQLSRDRSSARSFVRRPGAGNGDTTIPLEDDQPPPLRRPTRVGRSHTLSRPERGHPMAPLLASEGVHHDPFADKASKHPLRHWWKYFAIIITFWAPPSLLAACGMHSSVVRQAWREKVALVTIAALLSGIIAFITIGLQRSLCPKSAQQIFQPVKSSGGMFSIQGQAYNGETAKLDTPFEERSRMEPGMDLTPYLGRSASSVTSCNGQTGAYATLDQCIGLDHKAARCMDQLDSGIAQRLNIAPLDVMMGFEWDDVSNSSSLLSIDGVVLNMEPYLDLNPNPIPGDLVDEAIRTHFAQSAHQGPDATRLFTNTASTRHAMQCLKDKYIAGRINYLSTGCFMSQIVLYISLIVILGIVFARTIMALWFHYVGSRALLRRGKQSSSNPTARKNRRISHQVLPADAGSRDPNSVAPWANKAIAPPLVAANAARRDAGAPLSLPLSMTQREIGNDPFVVCLVTCYSEGPEGISATLSSLAKTQYPANRQLLFVVADGMVTGFGESITTPDICVGLMSPDSRFGTPVPMSYGSVATGNKAHNMALVYAGHYIDPSGGEPVPMIVVAKCGTPSQANDAKPGNRGKRDSQMILLNFLQRVTYDDPMTPLDYDLFRKTHALMGVTPDYFELVLMVDADTKVMPPALRNLCDTMMNDRQIMGACGETQITNKTQSWVTMIQVFEYFISHHQVKAFESVFGGVTCLPGCFSIYRIKARKANDDDWIPVVIKPEVLREYSETIVTSLHDKNLLLLGEDRFLSTMLLRTFPHRKMMFVPQAICKTEVPHTFRMLLSQRRRWINSTVHNLMELVLVRDLCGTFCFSMQFVVLMDLVGTLVLPVAILLTYTLIVLTCVNPPKDFSSAIPIIMLISVLILPGAVITLAQFKFNFLGWLVIYLIFLPVWNLILPIYSFWHFDDFSWGETRKIMGEIKGESAATVDAEIHNSLKAVPQRQWEDWERSRVRKLQRDERRRAELQNQFGSGFYNDSQDSQTITDASRPPRVEPALRRADRSDATIDSTDRDDDRWGDQIGAYDENQLPPELLRSNRPMSMVQNNRMSSMVSENDMEDLLQSGWAEQPDHLRPRTKGAFASIPNYSITSLPDQDPLSEEPMSSSRQSIDMGSILPGDDKQEYGLETRNTSMPDAAASSAIGSVRANHARNRSLNALRFETPYDTPRQ
ncbi:chitin synthase [Malassezia yamatoensis]|uniref:chitin synthase n=1 Tax=Malassezia yamatoensis TaxID=253288 RepID=A0AAJ5YTS7_9BASI|nr:chitin synthase [Malassezia yamatoensis]